MLLRSHKTISFVLFFIVAFLLSKNASNALVQEQEQALGELKIEGKHVERLVLCRKNGRTEQFNEPNEVVKLAVGKYRLQDVSLKDGYTCNSLRSSTYDWVTVTENEPAVLKVGAPLKQILKVKRQGKTLTLDYKLLGVGGEAYTSAADRSNPPKLTVYKGDKEIAKGKFAYG